MFPVSENSLTHPSADEDSCSTGSLEFEVCLLNIEEDDEIGIREKAPHVGELGHDSDNLKGQSSNLGSLDYNRRFGWWGNGTR